MVEDNLSSCTHVSSKSSLEDHSGQLSVSVSYCSCFRVAASAFGIRSETLVACRLCSGIYSKCQEDTQHAGRRKGLREDG